MKTWNSFSETGYGYWLKAFFHKLNNEIAEASANSSKQEAILLLNTRKGYWMYKLFEREEPQLVKKIKLSSDRFIKKVCDFSQFEGKIVYLVDDTLSKGFSLLESYQLLLNFVDKKDIYPVVFAVDSGLDFEDKKKNGTGIEADFWNSIQYYVKMSEDEMGKFCLGEMEVLHSEGIPFVIDLPLLKDSKASCQMNFQIVLTKEDFIALKNNKDRKSWQFHLNHDKEEEKEILKGFVIQHCDQRLFQISEEFAWDFLIEGTYIEDGEYVYIVFIPFAILKSMNKDYLKSLWRTLFDGICELNDDKKPENWIEDLEINYWIKMHRECVFFLSMLIGQRFRKYMEKSFKRELDYNFEIMVDHFEESFICCAQRLEKVLDDTESKILDRLENLTIKNLCHIEKKELGNGGEKQSFSESKAYKLCKKEILKRRDSYLETARIGRQDLTAVLSLEEMRDLLDENFEFDTEDIRRYALTRVIVTMLNTSTCSNKVVARYDGDAVVRGFRYGENSDILLPFFNVYFYWAVLLFVEKVGRDSSSAAFDEFAAKLKKGFEELELLAGDFSEDDFNDNVNYYKKVLLEGRPLYNKYLFITPYFNGEMEGAKASYMRKITEFMEKIN